jgi:hypothetical protein
MSDELRPASASCCPFCGAPGQDAAGFCLSCELRWEEMECRQLRERLFGVVSMPDPFLAT